MSGNDTQLLLDMITHPAAIAAGGAVVAANEYGRRLFDLNAALPENIAELISSGVTAATDDEVRGENGI